MNATPRRVRITTGEQFAAVKAAGKSDHHDLLLPTDALMLGEEVVGAASVGSSCLVLFWGHTEKLHARQTLAVIRELEAHIKSLGVPAIIVPVSPASPLAPFMAGLGYTEWDQFTLYTKEL